MAWARKHYIEAFGLIPAPPRTFRARLRRMMKPSPPTPRVLDVPCGEGFWSSVLADGGLAVTGVDLSSAAVEHAAAMYPGIDFFTGNAESDLPVEAGSFDVVFSRGISHLHHEDLTAPNTEQMICNLMRYVAPGGQLLVSYYTKRDGTGTERHHYHPVSDLVRLCELAGDVFKVEVVGDFVQIGVRQRSQSDDQG